MNIRNALRTTTTLLAAAGLAFALSTAAGTGIALADGLDVSPPAIIDDDGFQNYDTSTLPADPTWPSPPSWGSYPTDSTWPGKSSHPCCSR